MLSIPDVPIFHEWVMLIQQDPARAKQLLIALKVRNKKMGLMADVSLERSTEAYEQAQDLCTKAATDPKQAARITRSAHIGRATAGPYPDREDWATLIKDNPEFAHSLYMALRAKQAMFGLQTPQDLLISIAAYASASEERFDTT